VCANVFLTHFRQVADRVWFKVRERTCGRADVNNPRLALNDVEALHETYQVSLSSLG